MANDVTKIDDLPIPTFPTSPEILERNRIIACSMDSRAYADIYRFLRAQILLRLNGSTLAVSSCHPNEGKSAIAANLAVSMAMNINHSVALVDLDLRKPGVHKLFGIEPSVGLSDYFAGDVALSECFVQLEKERLFVLPNQTARYFSFESILVEKILELTDELKKSFSYVIYDLPPLLLVDDCLVFMKHVDGCLFVVREGGPRKSDVERALRLLKGHNLVGTVLNDSKSEMNNPEYNYYYG